MDLLQKHLNELLETITSFNVNQNSQILSNSTSLSSSSSSSAFLTGPKQTINNNALTCNSLLNASITNTSLLATTIPSVLSDNNSNNKKNNIHSQTKSPSCSSLYINKTSSLNNQKPPANQESSNQIACKLEDILKSLIQVFTNDLLIIII